MSPDSLDFLLERFDKTEPRLQRRIVARLAEKAAVADVLLNVCKAVVEEDGFRGSRLMRKRIDAMKAAIAKAEALQP